MYIIFGFCYFYLFIFCWGTIIFGLLDSYEINISYEKKCFVPEKWCEKPERHKILLLYLKISSLVQKNFTSNVRTLRNACIDFLN